MADYRLIFNPESGWTGKVSSKPMTERQFQVFELLCLGLNNEEIAEKLGIKVQTVKNHLYKLTKNLGAKNHVQALMLAVQSGMIKVNIAADGFVLDENGELVGFDEKKGKKFIEKMNRDIEKGLDI